MRDFTEHNGFKILNIVNVVVYCIIELFILFSKQLFGNVCMIGLLEERKYLLSERK